MVKLEVGKWYKFSPYSHNKHLIWYVKYLKGNIIGSEFIENFNGNQKYREGGSFNDEYWEKENTYKEASISEIAKYLPKNHPDLKQNILQSLEIW